MKEGRPRRPLSRQQEGESRGHFNSGRRPFFLSLRPSVCMRKIKMADEGDDEYAGDDRRWERGRTTDERTAAFPFGILKILTSDARAGAEESGARRTKQVPVRNAKLIRLAHLGRGRVGALLARDLKFRKGDKRATKMEPPCSFVRSFFQLVICKRAHFTPSIKILDVG